MQVTTAVKQAIVKKAYPPTTLGKNIMGRYGKFEIGHFSTLVGVIVASNAFVRIGDYFFLGMEAPISNLKRRFQYVPNNN